MEMMRISLHGIHPLQANVPTSIVIATVEQLTEELMAHTPGVEL
jgi:hypothetical protein